MKTVRKPRPMKYGSLHAYVYAIDGEPPCLAIEREGGPLIDIEPCEARSLGEYLIKVADWHDSKARAKGGR